MKQATYTIEDLDITGKSNLTIIGEPGSRPVLDGDLNLRPTCSDITLERFKMTQTGTLMWALLDARQCQGITFSDIEVEQGGMRFRDCDGCTIEHSYVHDGLNSTQAQADDAFCACGIDVRGYKPTDTTDPSVDVTIRDSVFERLHGDGIHLNGAERTLIEGNAFDTATPDGTDDHTDTIQLLRVCDATVRLNSARNWQHGILITDDAPIDCATGDPDDRGLIMENNIFEALAGEAFNGPPGPNGLICNNTFTLTSDNTGGGEGVLVTDTTGSATTWRDATPQESRGAIFCNNIVAQPGSGDAELSYASQIEERHNYTETTDGTPGTNTIVQSGIELTGDFELQTDSPAINAADATYAPTLDMLGRPRGREPDIGAKEYQG